MDNKTQQVLYHLQDGFKLETRPFKRIANEIGCSEDEVMEIIKKSYSDGIIRRIGAAIRPDQTGYTANALVAWQVAAEHVDIFGNTLAEMREISHCYERECPPDWPYNMFTMIHARSEDSLQGIIHGIVDKFSVSQYKVLRTARELKKTSMRYFEDPQQ